MLYSRLLGSPGGVGLRGGWGNARARYPPLVLLLIWGLPCSSRLKAASRSRAERELVLRCDVVARFVESDSRSRSRSGARPSAYSSSSDIAREEPSVVPSVLLVLVRGGLWLWLLERREWKSLQVSAEMGRRGSRSRGSSGWASGPANTF